jgi:hypothetical protein
MMMGQPAAACFLWLVAERGVAVSYENCVTRKPKKLALSNRRSSPAYHVSEALCQHQQVLFYAHHYLLVSSVSQARRSSCRSCREPQRCNKAPIKATCLPALLTRCSLLWCPDLLQPRYQGDRVVYWSPGLLFMMLGHNANIDIFVGGSRVGAE